MLNVGNSGYYVINACLYCITDMYNKNPDVHAYLNNRNSFNAPFKRVVRFSLLYVLFKQILHQSLLCRFLHQSK